MASSSNIESLGGTPEASEFGAALRDMRTAHNTDVSTVASTLRIRQVYLEAIEDGRFDDLPGPTYAAGFVRAYAEYLGLDISETMQRYRDVTGNASAQAPLVAPSPVVEGRMPTGFILLVAAVLAATAYGSWYYLSLNGRDAGDLVAKLPQRIADMVGISSEEAPPATAPSTTQTSPAKIVSETSSAVDEMAAQKAAAEEPAAATPAMPEPVRETPANAEPAPEVAVVRGASSAAMPTAEPDATPQTAGAAADDSAAQPGTTPSDRSAPANDVVSATPITVTPVAATENAVPAAGATVSPAIVSAGATDTGNAADRAEVPASVERNSDADISAQPSQPLSQQAALPEPPVTAVTEATSRVVLRATAISWVELRDAVGKRVFSRLLKKGEIYNVPAQPGITLATGNAGALDILVDGQVISPIGPLGAVRRDVLLEPASLLGRSPNER